MKYDARNIFIVLCLQYNYCFICKLSRKFNKDQGEFSKDVSGEKYDQYFLDVNLESGTALGSKYLADSFSNASPMRIIVRFHDYYKN